MPASIPDSHLGWRQDQLFSMITRPSIGMAFDQIVRSHPTSPGLAGCIFFFLANLLVKEDVPRASGVHTDQSLHSLAKTWQLAQPAANTVQPSSQLIKQPPSSILPPPSTPPSSLLPTLPLFHLPALRRLSFLQPLHALRLPCARLVRHILASDFEDQGV